MEIEITSLLTLDCFELSHSRAEGGDNAGTDTWNASKAQAEETPLLDTEEKLEAMREFARESGGWDAEEIAEWDSQEINALFLQWIAGDVREMPSKDGGRADDLSEVDWKKTRKEQERGSISGNIYKSGRRVYFYLGN